VAELAEPFEMTQPAISKHLKVLERAGLISRGRDAQRRPRRLEARPLAEATEWLENYRQHWEGTFQRLDALLDVLKTAKRSTKSADPPDTRRRTMMENTLKLTTRGDREIVMSRSFDAPRQLVFDAFTKPELVRRWLLGPGGWTMPVCEIDLRVGGKYRYVWRHEKGHEMGMGGVFREIVVPERLVATEKFDESWYPGEALDTTLFIEQRGKTTITQSVLYDTKEARDAVLKSPMESGVAAGYDRLEKLLVAGTADLEKGA